MELISKFAFHLRHKQVLLGSVNATTICKQTGCVLERYAHYAIDLPKSHYSNGIYMKYCEQKGNN